MQVTTGAFKAFVLYFAFLAHVSAITLTADTYQEEFLELTCIVYNGEKISLWVPPYVDEFQMQFVLISSPLISRTVDGIRFESRLVRAEMVPSSSYANFEVVLTVTPAVSPLTIFCGNGFDSVNKTISVGGVEDGCPSFTPDHVVACPGDEVVFNCTVLDTAGSQTTIWSANLTTGDISCVIIHALGLNDVTVCAPNNITVHLVEVDNTCYTSVLQLTVTQDMHNVVVQCSSPTVQNVTGSGTLFLVDDMPLPPTTLQYSVLLYRQEHVDIVVEWQYPPDGPRVDNYTLSVSNGTDEVLTDISEDTTTQLTLPYSQNNTLSVTASNCIGTSAEVSVVYFEAGCGPPPSPTNGYVDDFESSKEGAELVYECNPGLLPTGRSISTCIAGDWVPDPAALLCSCSGSEDAFFPEYTVACPGDLVTFSCTVIDALGFQVTTWAANTTGEYCSVIHVLGGTDTCGPFTSELGTRDDENDCFPSTLSVVVTADLDNTLIECFSPNINEESKIGSGLLVLQKELPLPPTTLQYSVLLYRQEHVDIVVEWQYPLDGPRVDKYTLSVTDGTDEVLTDINEDTTTQLTLPYNQNITLSVTASNCIGTSADVSVVYFEAGCGLPPSPTNGYVDDFESSEEGAELVYECNPGLLPTGRSISTCIAGDWAPDPAALLCSCPGQDVTPPGPPPASNANLDSLSADGSVATYSCDSALYELQGSCSIEYDEGSGWPDAPECKVVGWIVFLIVLVLVMAVGLLVQGIAIVYLIIRLKRQGHMNIRQEVYPCETVEMKANMSYGPVQVQSHTHSQGPADYEQPVNMEQARDGENAIYEDI